MLLTRRQRDVLEEVMREAGLEGERGVMANISEVLKVVVVDGDGSPADADEFIAEKEPESTLTVDDKGNKEWRNAKGQLHRTDGPAVTLPEEINEWWMNGQRHREDGPAVRSADGTMEWWMNGARHRTDGPAVVWANRGMEWWVNGQRHREDGPAVEPPKVEKEWWVDGKRLTQTEFNKRFGIDTTTNDNLGLVEESEDEKPVDMSNATMYEDEFGCKEWRNEEDELHREDGPAVVWPNGTKEWWLDGEQLTAEEFERWTGVSTTGDDETPVEDGPDSTMTVDSSGNKEWRDTDGKLHRSDGPAVERVDGSCEWWVAGLRHNTNGPAVVKADGSQEWWVNGEQYSEKKFDLPLG